MVEVFKTNVQDESDAVMLIDQISKTFPGYTATFDLEDCDKILRVECATRSVESFLVINIVKNSGYNAEVLADDLPFNIPPHPDSYLLA